jgi:glycosyltransferase involved in cell wall biosynthesis
VTGDGRADVLFAFAYASWGTAARRGMCFSEDRMVETLMGHPEVGRLLVAETPRSAPIKFLRDRLQPPPPFPSDGRCALYSPLRLRRRDPVGNAANERCFARWDARARGAAARHGLERPAVITTHPLVAGFASLEWASSVTFYAYDDLAASPPLRRLWPAYEEAYRRVRERGRAVVSVSPAILEKVRPSGPSAVVPNGVDPAEWAAPGPPPAWFAGLPAPRLLYVGSLESRIDVASIGRAARAMPEASFALVGPMLEPAPFEQLRELDNVTIKPAAGRAEVVSLVGHADACLIPHLRSPLTEAMSPLKLYEYLAGGAPVAALDLPPIRGVSPRVQIRDELTDAVEAALALGRAGEQERRQFAVENSWQRRQGRIVEIALRGA